MFGIRSSDEMAEGWATMYHSHSNIMNFELCLGNNMAVEGWVEGSGWAVVVFFHPPRPESTKKKKEEKTNRMLYRIQ